MVEEPADSSRSTSHSLRPAALLRPSRYWLFLLSFRVGPAEGRESGRCHFWMFPHPALLYEWRGYSLELEGNPGPMLTTNAFPATLGTATSPDPAWNWICRDPAAPQGVHPSFFTLNSSLEGKEVLSGSIYRSNILHHSPTTTYWLLNLSGSFFCVRSSYRLYRRLRNSVLKTPSRTLSYCAS